jgi:hypothetical protein
MLADIEPVLAKTTARQARRQRRELERRESIPQVEEEEDGATSNFGETGMAQTPPRTCPR